MDKKRADFIISQYTKPLYGFAVNKVKNIQQAEELASRIVLEVYSVLLNKSDIIDINSYIFKVAHNVWTRYCCELSHGAKIVSTNGLDVPTESYVDDGLLRDDEIGLLRREIAFLSTQRRKIIMAYYFEDKKIEQISEQMNIPSGTIKWHLFECKKELKEGMENMRTIGELGLNPIRFSSMGHDGSPGAKGDTSDFLAKTLTQNVAYACYFTPHSINEIAQELGVSPIFVEDEINELVEYGFIDMLPRGKYRTNIVITGHSGTFETDGDIYKKYAPQMVDKYYSKLLDIRSEIENLPIYYTDHDYNFLLWSLIMYASRRLHFKELEIVNHDEVAVHRKDGGYYISYAHIENEHGKGFSDDANWENAIGYMERGSEKLKGLKLAVHWTKEPIMCWRETVTEDYKLLNHFINGYLPKDERNLDSYETLYSKGYLFRNGTDYHANIVYIPDQKTLDVFNTLMPVLDSSILEIAGKLDAELYLRRIKGQPEHMHKTIRVGCQNAMSRMHVYAMKNMLDRGILQLPSKHQQKQICNMMFVVS